MSYPDPDPDLALALAVRPVRSAAAASPRYDAKSFRYLLFGRALPTAIFGLSAWLVLSTSVAPAIRRALAHPEYAQVAHAVQVATYLLFATIPAVLYLTRPAPRASDRSLPARAVGFLAVTFVIAFPLLGVPSGPALYRSPTLDATIGVALTVGAWAFAVVALLYLRHNVSVIPEARSLVTSGPYRLVRHPLYLAEILAAIGTTFGELRVRALLALVVLIGLQVARTFYEERLLGSVFPEYAQYAAHTKRLAPRIW